jgi:outer membrane protein assembly factor BamB
MTPMYFFVNKLELKIVNGELFKINNNESVLAAIGDKLYNINIRSGQKILIHNFEREIQDLIQSNSDELIVFMGKKSKRFSLSDLKQIDDSEFEKYRISPIPAIGENVFVRIQNDGDSSVNYRGLYSIKEKMLLWKSKNLNNPVAIGEYIFSNSFTRIERFDFSTGELLWSRSVEEAGKYYFKPDKKWNEGEVERFLGVYKELLWVVLKNGLLIGLDVGTGRIVHQIKEPVTYPKSYKLFGDEYPNQYYCEPCLLDKSNGKVIGLTQSNSHESNIMYYEINLSSENYGLEIAELNASKFGNSHIEGGAIGYSWPFDNEYIYVCNYRDYKIALFSRNTKNIEWVHEIEVDSSKKSFIIKMEIQGNRWYILDNSKTLFVYERAMYPNE